MTEEVCLLLEEALTAFYESPQLRIRHYWAKNTGEWQFSLLGMLCALNGLQVVDLPKEELYHTPHEWCDNTCLGYLYEIGFSRGDILVINTINDHTHDLEIMQIRLERYIETGREMAFPHDDLHELDKERQKQWQTTQH